MDDLSLASILTGQNTGAFVLIALFNVAALSTFKRFVIVVSPRGHELLRTRAARGFLTLCQPFLGAAMGWSASYFEGLTHAHGAALGALAGFLSPALYRHFLRQYLPAQRLTQATPTGTGAPTEAGADVSAED